MATDLARRQSVSGELAERVLIGGDLASLTDAQRVTYYQSVCQSLGLNPLTKPFAYIKLNNKLTLYALKDATDQLRAIHKVSVQIAAREHVGELYVVTARATTPDGRQDEEIGAVTVGNLRGEALANALMKASTKAKRRVTLSICGLGWLDETEVETIPGAERMTVESGAPEPMPVTLAQPVEVEPMGPLDHYHVLIRAVQAAGYDQAVDGEIVGFTEDAPPDLIRPEYQRLQAWLKARQK